MRMRKIVKFCVFLIIFLVFFNRVQQIYQQKFIDDSTRIVKGFYEEEDNTIDVIALGPSSMWTSLMPIELYKLYGIRSYDMGGSAQPINATYLYLVEALKYQQPSLVILEIGGLKGIDISARSESDLRWAYGDIKMSLEKLRQMYISNGRKIDFDYISYLFPIFRYKDRWKELKKIDFQYQQMDKFDFAKGYLYTTKVSDKPITMDSYEAEAQIDSSEMEYFLKIIDICKERNIELLVYSAPAKSKRKSISEEVRQVCDSNGINFIEFVEMLDELDINTETDFRNDNHLNNYGAYKITQYIGEYIAKNYELDINNAALEESWERSVKEYNERYADDEKYKLVY